MSFKADGCFDRLRTNGIGVLLVVGATDAAGLNLEESVFGADLGEGELAELEGAGGGLDDRARGAGHRGVRSPRLAIW